MNNPYSVFEIQCFPNASVTVTAVMNLAARAGALEHRRRSHNVNRTMRCEVSTINLRYQEALNLRKVTNKTLRWP